MMFGEEEFKAVVVALFRAAEDFAVQEAKAAASSDTQGSRLAGAFASQAKILAERLQITKRFHIDADERELVLAAVRYCAQSNFERAEKETRFFEKAKRRAFAGAFGALADKIDEATKTKPN